MIETIILFVKLFGTVFIINIIALVVDYFYNLIFSESLLMGPTMIDDCCLIISIISVFLHAQDGFWDESREEVENYDREDGRWPCKT